MKRAPGSHLPASISPATLDASLEVSAAIASGLCFLGAEGCSGSAGTPSQMEGTRGTQGTEETWGTGGTRGMQGTDAHWGHRGRGGYRGRRHAGLWAHHEPVVLAALASLSYCVVVYLG